MTSDVVLLTSGAHGTSELSIRTATGRVLASVAATPTEQWSVAAGGDAAYWLANDTVSELRPDGTTRVVGHVPGGVTAILVSPDGGSFAYATDVPVSVGSKADLNTIWVETFGGTPHAALQELSDPSKTTAYASQGQNWQYYLSSWTQDGIAFSRAIVGGCGCGAFDMQMLAQYTSILNPSTGALTTLTASEQCPLTAVAGSSLTVACVQSTTGVAGSTGIVVSRDGSTLQQLTLSGKNLAGDGIFSADGTELAYATIPATSPGGCGAPPAPTALHVLDVASGAVIGGEIGLSFTPAAWLPGGDIYGTLDSGSGVAVVAIDPVTLAQFTLWSGAGPASVIGII